MQVKVEMKNAVNLQLHIRSQILYFNDNLVNLTEEQNDRSDDDGRTVREILKSCFSSRKIALGREGKAMKWAIRFIFNNNKKRFAKTRSSFNGMTGSECEVLVDGCFNTSVHVSFQNPLNTPVKVD